MAAASDASGPAAGFLFQFERALDWLARAELGSIIGIETGDDVTVYGPDGGLILEQDKHVLGAQQPFADRSYNLWRALDIWLAGIESNSVHIERAAFFLVTNHSVPECLARRISAATKDAEADVCINDLRSAALNPPKNVASTMERVLAHPSQTLREVLKRTTLLDRSDGRRPCRGGRATACAGRRVARERLRSLRVLPLRQSSRPTLKASGASCPCFPRRCAMRRVGYR